MVKKLLNAPNDGLKMEPTARSCREADEGDDWSLFSSILHPEPEDSGCLMQQ
jgi:hypothetical protein